MTNDTPPEQSENPSTASAKTIELAEGMTVALYGDHRHVVFIEDFSPTDDVWVYLSPTHRHPFRIDFKHMSAIRPRSRPMCIYELPLGQVYKPAGGSDCDVTLITSIKDIDRARFVPGSKWCTLTSWQAGTPEWRPFTVPGWELDPDVTLVLPSRHKSRVRYEFG